MLVLAKVVEEVWCSLSSDPLVQQCQISSRGRVKINGTIKRLSIDNYGRLVIQTKGLPSRLISRLVALVFIPNPENKHLVDHIDGNVMNNSVSNLRWATHIENGRNSKMSKNNTSGYKGVYKTPSGKYQAQIMVNRKVICLGKFDTAEQAHRMRDLRKTQIFGSFKRTLYK